MRDLLENVSLEHAYGTYEGEQYHRLVEYRRLDASVSFIKRAIELLDKHGAPADSPRPKESYKRLSIYDDLAHLMFEACKHAARVRRKDFVSWSIQHNSVWGEFFTFEDTETWRIVRKRLCHLLAKEVGEVATLAHFGNVALLGFCANVMGLNLIKSRTSDRERNTRALHRFVLWLIRKNYARLLSESSRLADALLVGKLSYDAKARSIVKTFEMGLSDVAAASVLVIDGAVPPTVTAVRRVRRKNWINRQ